MGPIAPGPIMDSEQVDATSLGSSVKGSDVRLFPGQA
jgi:hypothetical protein